jgi:cellulose synthase/poly-beta-1,6-N-acetylglucosamine synthase-like glycosyltransferase
MHLCARQFFYFFKKERKIRIIFLIITSHMQNIIQIYPCLLKLSHKQDTILKIVDFSTKNYDFPVYYSGHAAIYSILQ